MKRKFEKAPTRLFDKFADYFPYPTVDVVIRKNKSMILARRAIRPYKGKWNLPGGVIFKTETLSHAAKRIAKEELNLTIKLEGFLGVYENPVRSRHDISHVFIASIQGGNMVRDFQSSQVDLFEKPPKNMVPYQKKIMHDATRFVKKRVSSQR